MAKKLYSAFDDKKLYQAPETREWNPKTGTGWRRVLEGPDEGHWQLYRNWEAVPNKIDRSGVKDLLNFSRTGWGKGRKPTTIPTEEKEITKSDEYGKDLKFTMGWDLENPELTQGLFSGFTGGINLDTYYDETDTTNLLTLKQLYAIGNNDLVSNETDNKGVLFQALSNSFDSPPSEPSTPALTDADRRDIEKDKWYEQNYEQMLNREPEQQAVEKTEPLKTEAQARKDWLEKTRNSPAQKSKAFTKQELWEQSKKGGANKGRTFATAVEKPQVKSEDLLKKKNKRKG